MKILVLDKNHSLINQQLSERGFILEENFTSPYHEILEKCADYEGIIIRSRIPLDRNFIDHAKQLKFIARVGAGMENIDVEYARQKGIALISSPEGNRDAVAEHVLGTLLTLTNRLLIASAEVKNGIWQREENRGDEILGKTVGLIGYGNMGKAVAKRFMGFGSRVIFHDILPGLEDEYAKQVPLRQLQDEAEILSLHVPITEHTQYMINEKFISEMKKDFYFVNTARGKNVKTKDLVEAIKSGKIKGAALDVLEFEKSSFENLYCQNSDLEFLFNSEKVIVTPHIAGWSHQSKEKLAQVIVDKILREFG